MTSRFLLTLAIISLCFTLPSFALEKVTKRSFQVADSITMVRIVEPDVALSILAPPKIKISPNGKYFVVVTRSGNLTTNKNDYNLILYQSDQVMDFLNHKEDGTLKPPHPKGKILAQASTSFNENAFQKISWLEDSETLAFIGWFDSEHNQAKGQVYRLNIQSRILQKLTDNPKPVTDFAISNALQKILFSSNISKPNKDHLKPSYLVGVRHMNAVTDPNWESPPPNFQYYIQDIDKLGQTISVGRIYTGFPPYSIWLAPNGKKAVVLTTKRQAPKHWLEGYNYLKSPFYQSSLKNYDENTMTRRESILTQFSLLDISKGDIKPAVDAPTGLYVGGLSVKVQWLPDSNSVILANTALPLNKGGPLDKGWSRANQIFSTAEYDLNNDHLTPITYHKARKPYRGPSTPKYVDISVGQFYGLNLETSGLLRISQVNDQQANLPDKYYKKRNGIWKQVPTPTITEKIEKEDRLDVRIFQDLNSPPEIIARDKSTGRQKIISNFNPQFQDLTFGHTEVVNWKDRNGRAWQGGLVYPPGFNKGQKYPLVIQTHGFNKKEFLIDGPYDTASAFAAQALANKNIMVLQMMQPAVPHDHNERFIYQGGFESVIERLYEQGLIDKEKIGLIGWSGTGILVQHMLLYSDYPIAAATISDSFNYGISSYVSFFGIYAPGMAFMEELNGGEPWGENLDVWIANDPTFHLDLLHTPLRYEQYSDEISHWWGTYAILKRQKKPVEYYRFNDAAHALIKPAHRMASQGGNVDWFSFWLKGKEDPDPTKAEQYKRWHKLRFQQKESEINALQARIRNKAKN